MVLLVKKGSGRGGVCDMVVSAIEFCFTHLYQDSKPAITRPFKLLVKLPLEIAHQKSIVCRIQEEHNGQEQ